ncbi:hypothetical protein ARTHRO9AX_10212 [Arthrobacter sp. 9AX]|nr:hypothetical protein ARTHRO9AX_10212 [Arthrobacter sp. 9AX]
MRDIWERHPHRQIAIRKAADATVGGVLQFVLRMVEVRGLHVGRHSEFSTKMEAARMVGGRNPLYPLVHHPRVNQNDQSQDAYQGRRSESRDPASSKVQNLPAICSKTTQTARTAPVAQETGDRTAGRSRGVILHHE